MKETKDIDLVLDMVKDQDDIKIEGSVMSRSALMIVKGSVIDNIVGKIFKHKKAHQIDVTEEYDELDEPDESEEFDEYGFDDDYTED